MKITLLLVLLLSISFLFAQNEKSSNYSLNKTNVNDDYQYIAINQMKMWISNNGSDSHNPDTDSWGLFWPGGENATLNLSFADGLLWAGYIQDSLYVHGSIYRPGLQAGKILDNGLPDDPSLPKYKIYKIKKDWKQLPPGPTHDRYQNAYEQWPGDEGASFYDANYDGYFTKGIDKPLFIGDEVLWCVMNDMDSNRTLYNFGTMPIGLEIQLTVYGFTHPSLQDVLFKKYKIINKSGREIDSMFYGYFADTDLGNGNDDFVGCDTLLNLAHCYNSDNNDQGYYNLNPPAIGYKLVQGPMIKTNKQQDSAHFNNKWLFGFINLSMSSFNVGFNDRFGNDPGDVAPIYLYRQLNGLVWDGSPFVNLIDSTVTKFPFSGNPIDSTGWVMGSYVWSPPGDYRIFLNTGPISMAPKDTQEVVIAARGSSNLNSIDKLKNSASTVQYFYDHYNIETANTFYQPPTPDYYYLSQNFPNPFNSSTEIEYEIPEKGLTNLNVYDVLGRKIATLVSGIKEAGNYKTNFNSNNLPSGVYFYQLTSNSYSRTKKIMLIK